jgi:penicillin-binding protein 2
MNPQTARSSRWSASPGYDDNAFSQGISNTEYQGPLENPNHPLVNHAISDIYPLAPRTSSSPASASSRITRSRPRPDQDRGFLNLGGIKFRDWNPVGFGMCNIICGFSHSSDTFFYQAAAMLGIDRHWLLGPQLGFGARTGVDSPGGGVGASCPTNQWKLDTLACPDLPRRDLPGRHRPGATSR